VCLRPLACWDCGFEFHRRHGCLSLVSIVCCQVSETGRSLVQSSPTECGVSQCDCEASIMRRPWPTRVCGATAKRNSLPIDAKAALSTGREPPVTKGMGSYVGPRGSQVAVERTEGFGSYCESKSGPSVVHAIA
jgi:hypothetical protein